MPTQIELFSQMTIVLDRLIDNAQKMKDGVSLKHAHEELEQLQQNQHEILHELGEVNKLVEQSPPGGSQVEIDKCKSDIRSRLAQFQAINQEFFDNINTKARVIDPKDISKKLKKK